ncbi:hypothetical protein A8B75_18615 [Sphingomonadales bacterium EhC05]|nr:hypothetical protein A8B75_18615 [Sphingomonadales bacterium EhC05]
MAEDALAAIQTHPRFIAGLIKVSKTGAFELHLDVEVRLPLHMADDGISTSGVLPIESVLVTLPDDYPWSSPHFQLRPDFPRNFPHLMPFASEPVPCLVEEDQDEFFLSFGLAETGVYRLFDQLGEWFDKAAISKLMNETQGWEPIQRRHKGAWVCCDAEKARAVARKQGGFCTWESTFRRAGEPTEKLLGGATATIFTDAVRIPLATGKNRHKFTSKASDRAVFRGATITGVIWPDKRPDGSLIVSDEYTPESITSLSELREHAEKLGCGRSLAAFFDNLRRRWQGKYIEAPIPIGIILCVRRPFNLIGTKSPIEILPYITEINAHEHWNDLFELGDDEPVVPATHLSRVTPALLRSLSDADQTDNLSVLGCGSVGSKIAMHWVRSGQTATVLADNRKLMPHNLARHQLGTDNLFENKAQALADKLQGLGSKPVVAKGNIITDLAKTQTRAVLIPRGTKAVLNATASLAVRDALYGQIPKTEIARFYETALLAEGHAGYLLAEGKHHNPSHGDLMAELCATMDTEQNKLMFDQDSQLGIVATGQGCGSLTMKMNDARLSAMSAMISEHLASEISNPLDSGAIWFAKHSIENLDTKWSRTSVASFDVVPIINMPDWSARISPRVIENMKADAARYPNVETGGVILGIANSRLKSITIVDLIDAPQDSKRTKYTFELGVQGLQSSIERRHRESGEALYDLGTWHTHLKDSGPSPTDLKTARALSTERQLPTVMLILTPKRIVAMSSISGGTK